MCLVVWCLRTTNLKHLFVVFVMVEHVSKDSFEQQVLQSDKPVIVDFYADWCGPCKRLAPIFAELSDEVEGASFVKVDIEAEPDLAAQYSVQSIPTLIVFKDGQPVDRVMGLMPKDELRKVVEQHA